VHEGYCKVFSNKVINRWNDLHQSAVDAPSINPFKKVTGKRQEQPDGLFLMD